MALATEDISTIVRHLCMLPTRINRQRGTVGSKGAGNWAGACIRGDFDMNLSFIHSALTASLERDFVFRPM
jgi:hypothetical protein